MVDKIQNIHLGIYTQVHLFYYSNMKYSLQKNNLHNYQGIFNNLQIFHHQNNILNKYIQVIFYHLYILSKHQLIHYILSIYLHIFYNFHFIHHHNIHFHNYILGDLEFYYLHMIYKI
jgi:hypothetical protein